MVIVVTNEYKSENGLNLYSTKHNFVLISAHVHTHIHASGVSLCTDTGLLVMCGHQGMRQARSVCCPVTQYNMCKQQHAAGSGQLAPLPHFHWYDVQLFWHREGARRTLWLCTVKNKSPCLHEIRSKIRYDKIRNLTYWGGRGHGEQFLLWGAGCDKETGGAVVVVRTAQTQRLRDRTAQTQITLLFSALRKKLMRRGFFEGELQQSNGRPTNFLSCRPACTAE